MTCDPPPCTHAPTTTTGTPLHLAASEGQLSSVKYLCEHGADVNVRDRWGGTPLADACNHKHDAVAAYLRGRGGTLGMTPTELATKLCALAAPLGQGGGGPSIVLRTLQNIVNAPLAVRSYGHMAWGSHCRAVCSVRMTTRQAAAAGARPCRPAARTR